MTTTPIADMLGIDASSQQIATGFEFRGQKFYWCAPTPNQREALLHGQQEFLARRDDAVPPYEDDIFAAALALFLTPNTPEDEDAEYILDQARAAIAAQGGAE